eukprot:tig00000523_g1857.t1
MCEPEELKKIQRVEQVQTAAQLAGLLRSELVRAAAIASKDPEKEVPPMLRAVEDLARRGNAEQVLRNICDEVLSAFSATQSLALSGDIAALVHSGDPHLCRRLVDVLLRKANSAELADLATLSALAYAAGHLPPDTLFPSDWTAVLDFASEQVELLSAEGRGLGPSDAEAQVALELTAAVLAAYEAASSGPAAPPPPPPPAGGERFGDVVRRCKAAGRIVKKLYKASKVIMEGVSSMGATTVIDLVFWAKDVVSDEKGGILDAAREMWKDARIVVGKGPQLQGQGPWYARARLMGALAAGGQLEELGTLLRDKGGEGLVACALNRQLALVLASALVRAAEGTDAAQAAAAVGLLKSLAEKAGELGGADAARIAARALGDLSQLDDGGSGAARAGWEALQSLAEFAKREGAKLPAAAQAAASASAAVGCLAGFRRGAVRVIEGGVGLAEDVAEIVSDVPGLERAAGVAGELAAAARRAKDAPLVQGALRVLAAPEELLGLASAASSAAPLQRGSGSRDRPPPRKSTSTSKSAPPGTLKRAPPLLPTLLGAGQQRNGYLEEVLKKYKVAVDAAQKELDVKRAHVHGRKEDLNDPRILPLLFELSGYVELCGSSKPCRSCLEMVCASPAFVFVASRETASDAACLKALDEAIETGQEVFQFYLNGVESVLEAMPVGVDMRLSRFDDWQLDAEARWKLDVAEATRARLNKEDPLEKFARGMQMKCRYPRLRGEPAASRQRVTARWYGGAEGSSSSSEPRAPPPAPKWVVEATATAEAYFGARVFFCHGHTPEDSKIVQTYSASLERVASCWSEAEHWEKGERWVDLVARAIRNCTHFVIIVSPAAELEDSQHFKEEVAYACSRDCTCALVALHLKQPGKSTEDLYQWIEKRLGRAAPGRVQRIQVPVDTNPTGQMQPANALFWTEAGVDNWIRSQGLLEQFAERLSHLEGRGLLSLTDSALKQLGIDNVAARKRLLLKIATLSEAALENCDKENEPLCWTEEEVVAWVRSKGPLAKFADLFAFTGGPELLSLSDADLVDMGVDSFPARQRLLVKIAELEAKAIAKSLKLHGAANATTESQVVEAPAPAPAPAEVDGIRASISKFAVEVSDELRQDQDLALYVPPLATPDPKLPPKQHVDLHERAMKFLKALRPGANTNVNAGDAATGPAKPNSKRVLLLLGGAGTSKSTFVRFLERDVCEQWAKSEDSLDPELPVTVLVSLPQLVSAMGGVQKGRGLRQHVAAKLGVASEALPALRDSFGLVLLLDGYDEMGVKDGVNLWQENGVSDWASGALLTCRTEFLASLPVDKPHEAFFAPAEKDGKHDESALAQLHTVPFTIKQRDDYLESYVKHHKDDEAAWTLQQYQSALANTPGLAAFAENPFSLSMAARVLPTKTTTGGRLGMRDLYRLFLRDWLRRELYRGGAEIPRDVEVRQRAEDKFVEEGTELCRRLACILFRMSASQATIPDPRVQGQQKADAGAISMSSPEQGALCELLGDRRTLDVRNSCPLRRWRAGGSLGFSFVHKTLGEFLVAEALLESLSDGGKESAEKDVAISFGTRSIVEETTLVRFLAEAVQHEPAAAFGDSLVSLVEQSRHVAGDGDGAPAVLAAANAATVLVAAHFSLAGRDLRRVRIPKANLWRLEAAGANLQGADMRGCSLAEACLAGADLGRARLQGCRIPQWPAMMHPAHVTAVAWFPDGRRIVTGSDDQSVRVWDVETGAELLQLQGPAAAATVYSVAVSAGQDLEACRRDGRRIVSGSWDVDDSVRVWDVETRAELLQLQNRTFWAVSAVRRAGSQCKAGAGRERKGMAVQGALQEAKKAKGRGQGPKPEPRSRGMRDGQRIVLGSDDKSIRVWDVETGEELLQLQGYRSGVTSVAISADRDVEACQRDGRRIVSGSNDDSVRVWDAETGAELLQLQGHTQRVTSVAITVEAKKVKGRGQSPEPGPESRSMRDGRRIVSGSLKKSMRVWDAETGAELLQLQGHRGTVTSVVFSVPRGADAMGRGAGAQDGRWIVSGGWDDLVRVWDAETGAELLQLQGHAGGVTSVAVSVVRRAGSHF